jgi:agmatine deiminase
VFGVIKLPVRSPPSISGAQPASPKALCYRMPAEWEPHASTWFTWPRPDGISFPGEYDSVPPIYAELIRHLVAVEDVNINVWDASMEESARALLRAQGVPLHRVRFHYFPSYEPWCRDHGPIFLVRDDPPHRGRAIVDWAYNAWGGKYPPYDLDDAIPQHIARLRQLPLFSPAMILEGGSIEVNGHGTVLTTSSCLLNPNRNPALGKAEIAKNLLDFLGASQVLWLGEGIVGDDTDGHIDDLTRFLNPTTLVTVVEDDPADANYSILQENLKQLRHFRDLDGRPFRIVELPMPGVLEHQGQRLPASYANFYIANGLVLVPTYRHKNDRIALEILQREFPARQVLGLDSTALIWGLGSFHCITQQEPAVVFNRQMGKLRDQRNLPRASGSWADAKENPTVL